MHEPAPTRRQLEILALMADGKSRKEIAWVLFISEFTVREHLNVLYKHPAITGCKNPGWKAVALYVSGYWL